MFVFLLPFRLSLFVDVEAKPDWQRKHNGRSPLQPGDEHREQDPVVSPANELHASTGDQRIVMHADSEQSQSPLATQRVIDCQDNYRIRRHQRVDHEPCDDFTNVIQAPFVAIEETIKPRPVPVPRGIAGDNQIRNIPMPM